MRTPQEIKDNELDVNKIMGINNFTLPISGFSDPYITATFVSDDEIFANLFHNNELIHYHFFYNFETKVIRGCKKIKIECSDMNFPYKCFYNEDQGMVYSFYR